MRLQLQGTREVHEQSLRAESDRDGQDTLERHAQPVEPRVGAEQAVGPLVADS